MKYVVYLRVSKDVQDNRTQQLKCMKWVEKQDPKAECLLFLEEISSRKQLTKRTELMKALRSLEKDDVLVAQRLDRLGREAWELHEIKKRLIEREAEIIMVDQPEIKNKLIFGLYASFAEMERDMISQRTKDNLEAKKSRGERTGTVPYGYTLDPQKLVPIKVGNEVIMKPGLLIPDQKEQAILERIYQLFETGLSFRNISACLAQEGILSRTGSPFRPNTLVSIVKRAGKTRCLDRHPGNQASVPGCQSQ